MKNPEISIEAKNRQVTSKREEGEDEGVVFFVKEDRYLKLVETSNTFSNPVSQSLQVI